MDKIVDYIIKLSPVLIAGWALYLSFKNRRSKLREILYEKQFVLLLQLNQKIIDIETEIQILRQWIEKKDEKEIINSKTRYTDNLTNIVSIVQLEGNLILPEEIIQSTDELLNKYSELLNEIINISNELNSNKLFMERMALLYLWQDMIRVHIGIEKLSKENKRIIG